MIKITYNPDGSTMIDFTEIGRNQPVYSDPDNELSNQTCHDKEDVTSVDTNRYIN